MLLLLVTVLPIITFSNAERFTFLSLASLSIKVVEHWLDEGMFPVFLLAVEPRRFVKGFLYLSYTLRR